MNCQYRLFSTVLLAAATLAPARATTISFSDSFSPPSSSWSNLTGSWTASGGDYYAQHPNNNPFAVTLLPFDLTGYTLTVTVNGEGDSGIMVRTNAAATQWVALIIGGAGYGQGSRGGNAGTSIYFADSSNPSSEQSLVSNVFTPGSAYTITVTDVGNTFSAYINGSSTAVTSITDAVAGSDGEVGLYDDQPNTVTGSGSGTPTTFSSFSLQGTTPAPEPGTVLLLGAGLAGLAIVRRRAGR